MRHSVLALTSDGHPHSWMGWQDAVTLKYKGLVAWSPLEDDSTFFGGTSRMTGERSHIDIPSIIAIKGSFKKKDKAPTLTNMNLFRRDLCTCSYCGKRFNEDKLTRDHIVPVSKGGKDTWTNCTSACKRCNNIKDSMTLDQCGMELLWVPYVPSAAEALILQNRKILFDQAQYVVNGYISKQSRVIQYLNEYCGIKL